MTKILERPLLLVGCGKMGAVLLDGWLESGILGAGVSIIEPMLSKSQNPFGEWTQVNGFNLPTDLPDSFRPEVIVFAVKPQILPEILPYYSRFVTKDTLFLSIAAGTPLGVLERGLGAKPAVVRAMPNMPAALRLGISVACSNANVANDHVAICRTLLETVGELHLVDNEDLLDAVTAISGSGPAYIFHMIECLVQAGKEIGLPTELAERLAIVTVSGSGQLALKSDDSPAKLRNDVTSPGGTTEAAIAVLMENDSLKKLVIRAVKAAANRGRKLAM